MLGLRNVWRTTAAARGPGQDFGFSKQTKSEVNDVSVKSSLVKQTGRGLISQGKVKVNHEDQSNSIPVQEIPSCCIFKNHSQGVF